MNRPIPLSTGGSDRATGYDLSCKILRRGQDLILGWLDAPRHAGGMARVMLGVADPHTGALRGTLCLAEGIDNHCGPALALEPGGRLHFMSGAHHGDFLHRWCDDIDPLNPNHWSNPDAVGPRASYPSLVCDPEGTLHLAYRESNPDRWRLVYRQRPKAGTWSPPTCLAQSPTAGYSHFMQSMAIDAAGAIHIVFQFHFSETGHAADCSTYATVHIAARDGGKTWRAAGGATAELPITMDSAQPFVQSPTGGMRVNSVVLDASGVPWVHVVHPDHPCGLLCQLRESGVMVTAPGSGLDRFDLRGGRSLDMAFDGRNALHFLFANHPQGDPTPWFDPSLELHHAVLDPANLSASVTVRPITREDPATASWLPVFEKTLCTGQSMAAENNLWYMWTQGNNLGGIGGDNANTLKTRVWLSRLSPSPT